MKIQRGAILAGVIAALLLVTNLFDASTNSRQYSNSFPSVVCPPNPTGVISISSLASKKTLFSRVGNKSTKLVNINTVRYSTVTDPILIESKGLTPVTFQSRTGVWAGSVLCTAPATSQWFVGGTSDVSSKGMIYLVNSGLSLSIVDIFTWSERGEQSLKTLSIKANSTTSIKLDSLAPGDSNIVINVVARSGRVNSFLIDERGKGLQKLGGDSVNAVSAPANKIVIAGIPQQLNRNKVPEHYLRLFVPGVADANFTLELLSNDGRFIPVGYNERKLVSGKVIELKLKPKVDKGEFAIKLTSDQPLVAAIRSRATSNGRSDFVWSTPSPALGPMQIAVGGLAPKIIFAGDAIAVDLKVQNSAGDIKDKSITGSDLVTWQVPNNTIAISIVNAGKDNYAGALIAAKSGYAFFPIASGAELTKAAIPSSNIQVLNP
jgi:hypothetical protein